MVRAGWKLLLIIILCCMVREVFAAPSQLIISRLVSKPFKEIFRKSFFKSVPSKAKISGMSSMKHMEKVKSVRHADFCTFQACKPIKKVVVSKLD